VNLRANPSSPSRAEFGGAATSRIVRRIRSRPDVEGRAGRRPERRAAQIHECYLRHQVPGTAMVNVVIAKSGRVSKATVTGKFADTVTGACVEAAVKTAAFPPSDASARRTRSS
jgi:hypothetical protein